MKVYIDIIFIENAIIDLFLMLVTLRMLRLKYRKKTIYISAALGGIYGLVPITDLRFLSGIIFKIIIAMVMLGLAVKERVFINIFKATVMFFMLSFTLCGVSFMGVLGTSTYTITSGINISSYSIKWLLISIMFVGVIAIRVYDIIKERAVINNFIYDIYIAGNDKILMLKGFLDTGNELREPVTNLPCILMQEKYVLELKEEKSDEFLINYKTIDNNDVLHGFRGRDIKIKGKNDSTWREIEAVICTCKTEFSKENDYQVLLSRGVI